MLSVVNDTELSREVGVAVEISSQRCPARRAVAQEASAFDPRGSSKTAFPRDKDLPCNMAVTQSLTENKPGVKLAPGEKNPLQNKSP